MATASKWSPVRASVYSPLNSGNYEIRMLTILPAGDNPTSMVSCQLETTTLFDTAKYNALSYCWGDPNVTRNIILENIAFPITVNLANALFRLRSLNVTRVWVDALCINQQDNQEKSYQIRNMRHIYEKAEVTFSWLGLSWTLNPAWQSKSVMALLRSISQDDISTFSKQVDHLRNHLSNVDDNCQRCRMDSQYRCLQDFFNLDYWHRCWIIQEISASSKIQLLCGTESMDWDYAIFAIGRNRASWSDELLASYRCLGGIIWFRWAYQYERRPSLCQAIVATREFRSTDTRDRIFAILGVSADGAEIIQTPNYLQDIGIISRDITRSIIRKSGRLELILFGKHTFRHGLLASAGEHLPTWSPDWFSVHLPAESYLVASLTDVTKHKEVSKFVSRHGDGLEAEGISIGCVVDCTTALDSGISSLSNPPPPHPKFFNQTISYYQSTGNLVMALVYCLSIVPWQHEDNLENEYLHFTELTTSKMFTSYSAKRGFVTSPLKYFMHVLHNNIVPWLMLRAFHLAWYQHNDAWNLSFSTWLQANDSFIVNGKSIKEWLGEGRSSTWPTIVKYHLIQVSMAVIEISIVVAGYYAFTILWRPTIVATILTLIGIVFIMWAGLGVTEIIFHLEEYPEYRRLPEYMRTSAQHFQDSTSSPSKKILLFDRGFIGMTFANPQKGDVAYFLLGCHKAVLLREVWNGSQTRYEVVGEVTVWLSHQDRHLYEPFWKILGNEMGMPCFLPSGEKTVDDRVQPVVESEDYYHALIKECRRNGSLQKLELI